MKFYRAKLQTENYSFEAYGETKTLAIEHMKLGLSNHAVQRNIPSDWWHAWGEEIYVLEFEIGRPDFNSFYRDGSLLKDDGQ
jgi:hypothetical protein